MANKDGVKHHYIPKFYLKQWAGKDGRVCEFSRPYQREPGRVAPVKPPVRARRVYPDGTGYERGLYSFPRLNSQLADFLEHRFFRVIDDAASIAVGLLNRDVVDFTDRRPLARFIMSLIHRVPERIQRLGEMVAADYDANLVEVLQQDYDQIRSRSDPPTFDAYRNSRTQADVDMLNLQVLTKVMNSEYVGNFLTGMRWGLVRTLSSNHPLLTSDRPIMMTNGLERPDAHILLPVSPVRIFVAAHSDETLHRIDDKLQSGGGVQILNKRLVQQAYKYVWAVNNEPRQFIEAWLGDKIRWSPLE